MPKTVMSILMMTYKRMPMNKAVVMPMPRKAKPAIDTMRNMTNPGFANEVTLVATSQIKIPPIAAKAPNSPKSIAVPP